MRRLQPDSMKISLVWPWKTCSRPYRRAQELPAVKYVGLHFHIGSQITELEPFENLVQRVNELQNVLDTEGIRTEWINVGGGLGVNYAQPEADPIPDFAGYFRVFKEKLALRPEQQVHFELGRAVVAQCGSLICRVLYVKHGHEKDFVIVDAGMTDLMRPALYGSTHEARNLSHPRSAHCPLRHCRSDMRKQRRLSFRL